MEIDKKVAARAQRILEIVKDSGNAGYIELYFNGYAEPGYSEGESGIIALGNWNDDTKWDKVMGRQVVCDYPSRVLRLFERMGIECEWSDEWCSCSNCGKLVRTSADSYGWTPSYTLGDGELNCHECLEEDPESHLESLEGNSDTANTISSIDPEDHGYFKINEYSFVTGWFSGQTDDPRKVAKELEAKGIKRYLFNIDNVRQFDSRWSVYVHESEVNKLEDKEESCELPIQMTEEDYRELVDCYGGVCLACGAFKYGDTEPDAESYPCNECDAKRVQGIENALIAGNIELIGS